MINENADVSNVTTGWAFTAVIVIQNFNKFSKLTPAN